MRAKRSQHTHSRTTISNFWSLAITLLGQHLFDIYAILNKMREEILRVEHTYEREMTNARTPSRTLYPPRFGKWSPGFLPR